VKQSITGSCCCEVFCLVLWSGAWGLSILFLSLLILSVIIIYGQQRTIQKLKRSDLEIPSVEQRFDLDASRHGPGSGLEQEVLQKAEIPVFYTMDQADNQEDIEILAPTYIQPPPNKLNNADWMAYLDAAALSHLEDNSFTLDVLCETMEISRRQFQRRLKAIAGLTATEYLNELRLQRALQLLQQGQAKTVKSLAASVGVRDVKYFSQAFKKRFGVLPSSFLSAKG